MFKFLKPKAYPIGIDLGSSSLKLMQLAQGEDGPVLQAAAKSEVPTEIRKDPAALQSWYIQTIRDMLVRKPFKGRRAVTCLPARELLIQHLRVAKMDEAQLAKALIFEAQDKVPFNIRQALLRHMVAGEIYEGAESKLEVILMAASRGVVQQHLNLIEKTKIEIDTINVEPCALVNGFAHLLQNSQQKGATLLIDIGNSCTKVVACQQERVVFSRIIPIAADHFREALCQATGIGPEQAIVALWNMEEGEDQIAPAAQTAPAATATLVERETAAAALAPILQNLVEEIRSCIRYHDLVFGGDRIIRAIFLGGQSKTTWLCQKLARGLNLPAQLGDPLARIGESLTGPHSDILPGQRNCEWAVAYGLSMGLVRESS